MKDHSDDPPITPPNNRLKNNIRFPGQYFDFETGLHYNYFRIYDPKIGRYREEEPIEFDNGDTNLYAYLGLTPLR